MLQIIQNKKLLQNQAKQKTTKLTCVNTFEFSSRSDILYSSGKIESNQTVPILVYNMRTKLHLGRAISCIAAAFEADFKCALESGLLVGHPLTNRPNTHSAPQRNHVYQGVPDAGSDLAVRVRLVEIGLSRAVGVPSRRTLPRRPRWAVGSANPKTVCAF